MKIIIRYLKKYWFFALAAPLMMLLEVFMDLMMPTTMAFIVDEGIASGNLSLVLHLGLRMLLFSLLAFIGGGSCSALSSFAATGLGADLRSDLYSKVLSLSHRNLDELETGNLITRLTNDVSQLEDSSLMLLRLMVRAPLQIIGSLIMALTISVRLSRLFILFVPVLVIIIYILIRRAYPLFYRVQEKIDKVNTRLQENLLGKRLVKAFVREDYESEKFQKANNGLMDTTIRANRTMSLMDPAMQILLNGGIIAALWFGAQLIDWGTLQIGALIAFIAYLRQLLFSLMMFSHIVMRLSRAQASSERVAEVLDTRPDVKETGKTVLPLSNRGMVEFKQVHFSYRKEGDLVLKNINFTANPGETIAIIGATGSGKSSLVNLIPRFYNINSGQILMDGIDISDMDPESLRSNVAIVPQTTILFSGTLRDNILYHYKEEERMELQDLMKASAEKANIAEFIESLPLGYDTDINQRGVNLSGGQKQRIAIARALAKKAPILILDDSTSAVDMTTEKQIRRDLARESGQRTVFLIAQRISSVVNAHKILLLEEGEISGIGSHEELLADNPLYRDIYYSQVDKEAIS